MVKFSLIRLRRLFLKIKHLNCLWKIYMWASWKLFPLLMMYQNLPPIPTIYMYQWTTLDRLSLSEIYAYNWTGFTGFNLLHKLKKIWKIDGKFRLLIISPSHDSVAYPPNIYLPTLTMVTVGFLLSQFEWNVLVDHPSLVARQQSFRVELLLIHDFNVTTWFPDNMTKQ